jgi:rubrerythrin
MPTLQKFNPKIKILSDYQYDAVSEHTELMWRCSHCGELIHRKEGVPEHCPSCFGPLRDFSLVEED